LDIVNNAIRLFIFLFVFVAAAITFAGPDTGVDQAAEEPASNISNNGLASAGKKVNGKDFQVIR